jgi:hypothetical protein
MFPLPYVIIWINNHIQYIKCRVREHVVWTMNQTGKYAVLLLGKLASLYLFVLFPYCQVKGAMWYLYNIAAYFMSVLLYGTPGLSYVKNE